MKGEWHDWISSGHRNCQRAIPRPAVLIRACREGPTGGPTGTIINGVLEAKVRSFFREMIPGMGFM